MLNLDFFSCVICIRKIHSLYKRIKLQICFLRSEINTTICFQLSSEKTKFWANLSIIHKFSLTENAKNGGAHKNFVIQRTLTNISHSKLVAGIVNDRPMLMLSAPGELSTFPTIPFLLFHQALYAKISYEVLDSRPGFVNGRCRCPPRPHTPIRLCTLTNILWRVRLAPGVCEQPADVDALPALIPPSGFVRSQISYDVLDSRPGFVNNRPMSMPSPPLETTSPTHSPGSLSPRSLSPNQSRQGGAQRTK